MSVGFKSSSGRPFGESDGLLASLLSSFFGVFDINIVRDEGGTRKCDVHRKRLAVDRVLVCPSQSPTRANIVRIVGSVPLFRMDNVVLNIFVKNQEQQYRTVHDGNPLEFGRSDSAHDENKPARRIRVKDEFTSRHQLRIEQPRTGVIALRNLSSQLDVKLSDGRVILPGEVIVLNNEAFVSLTFGKTRVDLESGDNAQQYQTIAAPPVESENPTVFKFDSDIPTTDLMTRWFEELIAIQRAAASSDDFYDRSSKAMVSLIGFDHGMVLMRTDGQWKSVSQYPPEGDSSYSESLLESGLI